MIPHKKNGYNIKSISWMVGIAMNKCKIKDVHNGLANLLKDEDTQH